MRSSPSGIAPQSRSVGPSERSRILAPSLVIHHARSSSESVQLLAGQCGWFGGLRIRGTFANGPDRGRSRVRSSKSPKLFCRSPTRSWPSNGRGRWSEGGCPMAPSFLGSTGRCLRCRTASAPCPRSFPLTVCSRCAALRTAGRSSFFSPNWSTVHAIPASSCRTFRRFRLTAQWLSLRRLSMHC